MLNDKDIEQYMISRSFNLLEEAEVKYWTGGNILTRIKDSDLPRDNIKNIDSHIRKRCFESRHPMLIDCNECIQKISCESENKHKAGKRKGWQQI